MGHRVLNKGGSDTMEPGGWGAMALYSLTVHLEEIRQELIWPVV